MLMIVMSLAIRKGASSNRMVPTRQSSNNG